MRSVVVILLLNLIPLFAVESVKIHCYRVVDGDTMYGVTEDGDSLKIRLWGIDCPERDQPYGDSATQFVRGVCEGKKVFVTYDDTDKYGRIVGTVYLENYYHPDYLPMEDGAFVQLQYLILGEGLAWWSKKYAPSELFMQLKEDGAKKGKVGLWADSEPIAPWNWRKMSKVERDSVRALSRYR